MGAALPKRRSDPNSLLQQTAQPATVTHHSYKQELRSRSELARRPPELRMLQFPDHPGAEPDGLDGWRGPNLAGCPLRSPTTAGSGSRRGHELWTGTPTSPGGQINFLVEIVSMYIGRFPRDDEQWETIRLIDRDPMAHLSTLGLQQGRGVLDGNRLTRRPDFKLAGC